jgi:hypothetical protein
VFFNKSKCWSGLRHSPLRGAKNIKRVSSQLLRIRSVYPRQHLSVAFYFTALAPLGYKKIVEYPTAVAMGEYKRPDFTIIASGDSLGSIHF